MLVRGKLTNIATGESVPASAFTYSAPSGRIGASLEIILANPLTGSVPVGDSLKFELGAGVGIPPAFSFVPIFAEGRLAGRSARYSWQQSKPVGRPGDTLTASALDALGDRWQLAPPAPIILIDTNRVDAKSVAGEGGAREYPGGNTISPVVEQIPGLTLWKVLERAYTSNLPNLRPGTSAGDWAKTQAAGAGAGFARVITNLPNYPIERADFTPAGGWHEGAKAHFDFFEPIAYEDENILYIWDIAKALPAGVVPRSLPMSCYAELEDVNPAEEIVNGVFLTYLVSQAEVENRVNFPGGIPNAFPSFRFVHEDPVTGGDPGQPGYYRQEVTRKLLEYRDITTGALVFAAEVEVETTNYALNVRLNRETVTSRQTLQVRYQGKIKTGHTLTVESTYPNPARPKNPETELAPVYFEECEVAWAADLNNPGEYTESRTETNTRGVVLVEEELDLREGETAPRKTLTPILDASRGNNIILDPDEAEGRGVRQYVTADRPILTTIELFRTTGQGQAQVEITRTDHLKGVTFPPVIQSRTGSTSTASGGRQTSGQNSTSITEFIKDEASITRYGLRKVAALSVNWLGEVEGRRLALQMLRRKSKPRRGVSVTLEGLDLSMRRGTILRAATRSGAWIVFIVTGFTIRGTNLGTPNQRLTMALEGVEVLT